jgi:hypothetical protein
MTTPDQYEAYLKRFLAEYITPLSTLCFQKPEDYEFMLFLLFQGWRIIKKSSIYCENRFKKLAALVEMIDRFDDTLERPLQKREIMAIHFNPQWRPIQNEASVPSTFS